MATPHPSVDSLFLSFQQALAGRYSIDREIGRGGMGIVYLAREVHLDRSVAIKLLPPALAADETFRQRFLGEARLAAKLSHPNIIPIHAVEERGGFVYYVMAYIEGETLAQRVQARGPLAVSEGARVLREAAFALAYAHGQGLIHRDVKPDNILLESATGRALMADFGIAAAAADLAAEDELGVPGTPEFMSPEAASGDELDARSDIYSLGVTAYYAFSGRLPFEGNTPTEILAKHITQPAPPLASVGTTVPRKLALLVDRCLQKDRTQRPASASVLADQLGVALEQRKELPAALRAFVRKEGRLDGGGTLFGGGAVLGAGILFAVWFGDAVAYTTMFLGFTAAPFAYLVTAARRLALKGFSRDDLGPAFKFEIELSDEEHAVEHATGPSALEKLLRRATRIAWPVAIGTFGLFTYLIFAWRPISLGSLVNWFLLPYSFATLISAGYLGLLERRKDVATRFWQKVWLGPLGRAAFAIGRKLLGRRQIGPAMTHRATELSLGMAAENLFDALSREQQKELGDLPAVVRRLRDDAQLLRKMHDELQEAINDAGDAGASEEYADIRASRDDVKGKMSDAVGALETIRLNLLRLHAGSTSIEGLTTHMALAIDVSVGVERLIAAHDEIEKRLAFPRPAVSTPA